MIMYIDLDSVVKFLRSYRFSLVLASVVETIISLSQYWN